MVNIILNHDFSKLIKTNDIAHKIYNNFILISLYVIQNKLDECFKNGEFLNFKYMFKKMHINIPSNIDFYISQNMSILFEDIQHYPIDYAYIFYTELINNQNIDFINDCKKHLNKIINEQYMNHHYLLIKNIFDDYLQKFI